MQPEHERDAYQRVWDAFQRTEVTDDGRHDTPHWRAHTGPYAVCVVRVPAESLQPRLDALRGDLARLSGLRLHPDRFLHITLQELGFVVDAPAQADEISVARLEEFAQAAAGSISSLAPFEITIGGGNSFQDAVFLDVGRGGRLALMHERLFELAAIPRIPTYPYLPHCTIAHYDGSTEPQDAVAALTPWRGEILGQLTIAEVEIVTLEPSEPYPDLQSYAVIPLGM